MNDALGPDGTVLSSLVFDEFPRLRAFEVPFIPRASLAERSLAAQEARCLMAKYLAQARVKRALHHQTPRRADVNYQPDHKFLLWREKLLENGIVEWIGTYTVCSFDAAARIVLVQEKPDACKERYNVT